MTRQANFDADLVYLLDIQSIRILSVIYSVLLLNHILTILSDIPSGLRLSLWLEYLYCSQLPPFRFVVLPICSKFSECRIELLFAFHSPIFLSSIVLRSIICLFTSCCLEETKLL